MKYKKEIILTKTNQDIFETEKMRYNPHQGGTGAWKNKRKPNRSIQKQQLKQTIDY